MKNAGVNDIREDFVFIGGGNRYECLRIASQVLSGRVCFQHSIDPSINEYVFENDNSSNQFDFFMSRGQGWGVWATKRTSVSWLAFFAEIGDSDVCVSLLNHFHSFLLLASCAIFVLMIRFLFSRPSSTD
jgi:hypothetical protein